MFWITAAPILIAAANIVGILLGGVLTGRIGGRPVLTCLVVLSTAALLTMAIALQSVRTLIGLAIIGFTYGGTIATYPAYISQRFGAAKGTIAYGRIFTTWAAAGLLDPSVAGLLIDRYHNYQLALTLSAFAAAISFVLFLTTAPKASERSH